MFGEVLLHLAPAEPDGSPDFSIGQQAFSHPAIDGTRCHIQTLRDFFFVNVYFNIVELVLHRFRGAGWHMTAGATMKNRKGSGVGPRIQTP